eukprot:m.149887 g.149887  ORF g.149887 m.149887 type:complete len:651 (-) comp20650_c0_seq2:156-2108(-)
MGITSRAGAKAHGLLDLALAFCLIFAVCCVFLRTAAVAAENPTGLPVGANCTNSSECTYGSCLGTCCVPHAVEACLQCGSRGDCVVCKEGYYHPWAQGECVAAEPGMPCSSPDVCFLFSNLCLGGRCCSRVSSSSPDFSQCLACDSQGYCTECKEPYVPAYRGCAARPGANCNSSVGCGFKSGEGLCLGGHCCDVFSSSPADLSHCIACGSDGNCTECEEPYEVSLTRRTCLLKPGANCTASDDCLSESLGICLGGHCCNMLSSITPDFSHCIACGADGTCTECAYPFQPAGGNCLLVPGAQCAGDEACESGVCRLRCCLRGTENIDLCSTCDRMGFCSSCTEQGALEQKGCRSISSQPGSHDNHWVVAVAVVVPTVSFFCILAILFIVRRARRRRRAAVSDPESELLVDVQQDFSTRRAHLLPPSDPFPSYWQASSGIVASTVDLGVSFLATFQDLLIRSGARQSVRVTRVQRIENSKLWCSYQFRVSHLRQALQPECLPKTHDFAPTQHALSPADTSECYLFHGTPSEKTARAISMTGFEERVASGGCYGAGVYFAEDAAKAINYCGKNKDAYYIFVARVVLGCVYATDEDHLDVGRRAPCKLGHTDPDPCDHPRFDSVVAHPVSRPHREFVVYDRTQCYPEYLITFK